MLFSAFYFCYFCICTLAQVVAIIVSFRHSKCSSSIIPLLNSIYFLLSRRRSRRQPDLSFTPSPQASSSCNKGTQTNSFPTLAILAASAFQSLRNNFILHYYSVVAARRFAKDHSTEFSFNTDLVVSEDCASLPVYITEVCYKLPLFFPNVAS